jgi:microcystin-dependent protein
VWVYCDGTNFNAIGTESIGDFEVNGNLTVTGNTNAVAATYTGNVTALNFSTANVTATGNVSAANFSTLGNVAATGNVSAANFSTLGNVAATGNLSVTGTSTFTGIPSGPTAAVSTNNTQLATTAFVRSIIPAGVILMWSGSIANIPSGWLLCNGSSGTPDLRDRFVVGAGSTYAVNATGGATTVTLSTVNLPSHTHTLSASGTTSSVNLSHTHDYGGNTGFMNSNTSHSHSISDPGHAHNITVNGNAGGNFDAVRNDMNSGFPSSSAPYVQNNTTGITGTQSTDINHTHFVSGTTGGMSANTTHTHTVTVTGTSGATGSGTAFSILPPYFALAFIMKS